MSVLPVFYVVFFFKKKLEFTLHQAEQPLQSMTLQEENEKFEKHIGKLI